MTKQFCPQGHDTFITGRHVSRGCRICANEGSKKRYYADPESRRALALKRYYKNPQRSKECDWKRGGLLNELGQPFCLVDFDRLYQIQSGKCRGCQRHSTQLKTSLNADHCHATGYVRGLLCGECNRILGLAKDDKNVLDNLKKYLTDDFRPSGRD